MVAHPEREKSKINKKHNIKVIFLFMASLLPAGVF
jgi:hypothetical protein